MKESSLTGEQSLQVIRSGQICILGKFDVVKDKPAVKAP